MSSIATTAPATTRADRATLDAGLDALGIALPREARDKLIRYVDLLRRPNVTYASLMTLPGAGEGVGDDIVAAQVEVATKYEGYIERQSVEIERRRAQEDTPLPPDLDYREVRGLSIEVQQKLNAQRPDTIGHATRVSGVTPAAISLLLVHLKRGANAANAAATAGEARSA